MLVSAYIYRYGASSSEVHAVYKQLTELYIFIGETEKTIEFKEKTESAALDEQNGHSENTDKVSRSVNVTLIKHRERETVDTFEGSLFVGYQEETSEAFNLVMVESIFARATEMLKREEFEKTEELYIELWWK